MFAAAALGWLAVPLAALLDGRFGRAALVATLACGGALGLSLAPESERGDLPVPLNVVYTHLAGKEPAWTFGAEAPPLLRGTFAERQALPWTAPEVCMAATELDLLPPHGTVRARERDRSRATTRIVARSERDSPWLSLLIPPGLTVHAVTIAGVPIEKLALRAHARTGWRTVSFLGALPHEEIEFAITHSGTGRDAFYVADRTLGLPPAGRLIGKARDASGHAPIHMGDGVMLAAPVRE